MPRIFSEERLGTDRVQGFYETPMKTVQYMCGKILPHYVPGKKILDPAVGDGVFLDALLKAGVRSEDLYGFDIDQAKISRLVKRLRHVALFDTTNPLPGRFDFVVGNPPYNGDESHFVRKHRERLKRLFKEIDAKNTYSMITYQAIQALNAGGVICVILADSFLTNIYYAKFRDFLLRTTEIEELLLAPWRLFRGDAADVRTCIVTAKKKTDEDWMFEFNRQEENPVRLVDRVRQEEEYSNPERVEILRQGDFRKYPNAAFLIGLSPEVRKLYLETELRLSDVVTGGTGISTGNDKRFLRRRSVIQNDPEWVPYYKNGARQPYWYDPEFFIEKNYTKYAEEVENYLVRNESFFFQEGVSCSSVGVRFSAAYMPPGSLFGVNANFFFRDRHTMFYVLGIRNKATDKGLTLI